MTSMYTYVYLMNLWWTFEIAGAQVQFKLPYTPTVDRFKLYRLHHPLLFRLRNLSIDN